MNNNNSFTILYTCLSLLVLCFFIFLVANSVVDPQRKKEAIGSLIGAFGFFTGGISPTGEITNKSLGLTLIPLSKDQHLLQDLYEIVKLSGKEKYVNIATNKNSLFISFKKGGIFKKDSYIIKDNYKPILLRFYNRFSNAKSLNMSIIAYHESSLYIATYRAYNVVDYFSKKGIDYNDIQASGELNNSEKVLILKVEGYIENYLSNESNSIEIGDFKFKVE